MGCCRIRVPLLCLLLLWTRISAFNLDTENVITKSGDDGSLFGFSIAMHRQLNPDKRQLLVGAPRAAGLGTQASTKTGGLYACDINNPGSACHRVQFDDTVDKRSESKEDQWLGVVVQSQGPGGKVLTCAHRYQQRLFVGKDQELRDITGRCYVLSQDLSIDPNRDGEGGEWKFCSGRSRGHERFGSCQQGLSATFTKDYHYLIFGAPGAYNWKGIVRVEQKNDTLADMGIYTDGPYELGDENRQDENQVPVPANSYLGFSLDSGHALTKKGQLTVVAGAPRANHSGAVVFLTIVENTSMMSTEHILEGEELASSFGYDLAVLDLNADGWQDVVVGAPQFFLKDGEVGGAIYVYMNNKGVWKDIKPVRIDGTKDSMFGLSVENIGDVNLDRYEDVAVGAPYDDDGAGKVFIYHGSAEGIKDKAKPAQVLSGKGSGVRLFGYSLAGNMDLDLNFYPDVAIGSLSDSVFIYRARPVLSIEKDVKTSPKELNLNNKNCGDSICVDVEACFFYTANPKSLSPKIVVKYKIQTELDRRDKNLPPRVMFTPPGDNDYESTGTLELPGQNKRKCIKTKLQLKDGIRDKLRGIPIEVSVEIEEGKRNRRDLPGLAPILDSNQPTSVLTEVHFMKDDCGTDNICQSNLKIKSQFCSREPKDVFKAIPMQGSAQRILFSNQKEIALEVTVTNTGGDDAYEAELIATFPETLSYSATRTLNPDKQMFCVANQNGSQATCDLGNPFKKNAEVTFYIILSTGGISVNTTEVEIDLKLKTTSQQQGPSQYKARADVGIELLLLITGGAKPSQVYFSGGKKGSSAMKYETEIGSMIEFEFRIINLGKPLQTAALTIYWPLENNQGKYILYLMSVDSGRGMKPCLNLERVNELKLIEVPPHRGKREIASQRTAEEGTIALLMDKRKNKTLSCDSDARCIEIKCPLQDISNAVIKLRARLWNATFLEEYSSLNYLNVLVKATLSVDGKAPNIYLQDTNAIASVTVFPERRVAQYGGMPWWIILVAILLGLLLLALLIFLLWKCGFFGNKDDDPSEKEKLTSEA